MEKIYNPKFTEQDFNIIATLFNIAIKSTGLMGDNDIKARIIINKISESLIKEEIK